MSRTGVLVTLLLVAGCAIAPVATAQPQPLTIEADRKIDGDRVVIFIGNVVARQRHWLLHTDRMEVFLYGDRIMRATSIGNVRITTSDCQEGAAGRAEYHDQDQRVVLSGNARIWSPEGFLKGKNIVIYLPRASSGVKEGCAPAQGPEPPLGLLEFMDAPHDATLGSLGDH